MPIIFFYNDYIQLLIKPAVAAHLFFAFRQFPLLYFDVVFFGEEAKRIIIRKLLMLHNEVNSRTTFAAGKAFTDILCRRHIERGRLVAMERTQSYIVYASFPKGNEFGNNVHNVCGIQYPVYGRLIDHSVFYFIACKGKKIYDF